MDAPNYIIHETSDYDRFSFDKRNRPIRPGKVERLARAIEKKNLLSEYPIVVTPDMVIMDGQHRYSAAKRLGIPFYYIVSVSMTFDDVGPSSSEQSQWTVSEFLHYFCEQGKSDYLILRDFMQQYPWLTLQYAAELCHYGTSLKHTQRFKDGGFVANDMEFAHRVALACLDFKPYIAWYKQSTFVGAINNLMSNAAYDHERMVRKLKFLSVRLRRCATLSDYIRNIDELYNFKEPEANRVQLKKIMPHAAGYRLDRKGKGGNDKQ